jgi:hypothetical protein
LSFILLTAVGVAATKGSPKAVQGFTALIGFLYRLWAAFSVFQDEDFRYVIIGQWLERYLARNAGAKEPET